MSKNPPLYVTLISLFMYDAGGGPEYVCQTVEWSSPSPFSRDFDAVVMHVSFSSTIPTPDTLLDKATTYNRQMANHSYLTLSQIVEFVLLSHC